MSLTWIHILFMVFSFMLILGAVIYTHRQAKSLEGFSVSGRSASSYMVAGTFVGTMIGGSMTVGTVQSANLSGLSSLWMLFGASLGAIVLGAIYAGPLRNSGETTLGGYVKLHYGPMAGTAVSVVSSLGIFFSLVASGLSGLHFLQLLLPVSILEAMVILLLSVYLYVLIGGIKGTSISGIIKTALLYITLAAAGYVAFQLLGDTNPIWYKEEHFVLSKGTQLVTFADKAFSTIVGITVTQTYAQAVFSGASTQEAKRGCYLSALVMAPLGIPLVAIGSYIHIAHPELPAIQSLPFFLSTYLSPWLGGLALGTIYISIIGSIAGLSLGAATTITVDIIKGYFGHTNKAFLLKVLRFSIGAITLSAFLVSVLQYDSQVLTWNFISFSLRGAGIFLLLLGAVLNWAILKPKQGPRIILLSTAMAFLHIAFSLPGLSVLTPLDVGVLSSTFLILGEKLFYKGELS